MALIDPKATRKAEIPHEPGEWVEIRTYTARDVINAQRDFRDTADPTPAEVGLNALLACLVDWSYDAPISAESLMSLDALTYRWLDNEVTIASGRRTEDEKKGSDNGSSATSEPVAASFPKTSAT